MNSRINMTQDEQKAVMLNILKVFADFCEKNNLRYFLDAGTLIGAVRHKGYIPWDDDIDVNMPRKDMDLFLEMAKDNPKLLGEHICLEYPEDTVYPFLKISDDRTVLVEFSDKYPIDVQVYIDVFTKDGILDKTKKSKRICNRSEFLGLIHWFNHFSIFAWKKSKNIIKRIVALFGRLFFKNSNWAYHAQQRLIHNYAKKYPIEKCQYVTTLTNGEFHKLAPKECFDDYVLVDFEGYKFRAPIDYDTYLHCLYKGDYMQLPPEDKREHHNTIIYWISDEAKLDFNKSKVI